MIMIERTIKIPATPPLDSSLGPPIEEKLSDFGRLTDYMHATTLPLGPQIEEKLKRYKYDIGAVPISPSAPMKSKT
jgi:hypothetical protein